MQLTRLRCTVALIVDLIYNWCALANINVRRATDYSSLYGKAIMNTYEEWKVFANKPGAITTVMYQDWLLQGCPKCDGKEWELTNDGWAYCCGCSKGYSTNGIWVHAPLVFYDKNGYHCFMCRGYGKRDGATCEDCCGRFTQPETLCASNKSLETDPPQ